MTTHLAVQDDDLTSTDPDEARVKRAEDFRDAFNHMFENAMSAGEDKFIIAREEFDKFLIDYGHTSYDYIPNKVNEKANWREFNAESNTRRYSLNTAARLGLHGEPPYQIVNVGSAKLEVRFFNRMLMVTAEEIADQINSLIKTKFKEYVALSEFAQNEPDKLAAPVYAEVRGVQRNFARMTGDVKHMLKSFMVDTKEVFSSVQASLEQQGESALLTLEDDTSEK